MPVGAMVTLRGDRAYEFLDRLISVVIPRIRDFRGLPRKLDAQGNYNMGIAEQSVFPEVGTDLLENPQGMNIAITIRNGDERGRPALCWRRSASPSVARRRPLAKKCLIDKQQAHAEVQHACATPAASSAGGRAPCTASSASAASASA